MKDVYSSVLREALLEVSIQQLKQQFVDSGKVKEDDFKEVETAVGGKSAYATWLLKKLVDGLIKAEDIYKYKDYFNTFERRKTEYKNKDINQYKTQQDLRDFIRTSVELRYQEKEDPSKAKGVDKSSKYSEYKMGSVDGFDVYEIPKGRKDLYGMSCELGSGTEWCTATGKIKSYFDNSISKGPLYIFIKPGGNEKYQFSFAENQFMDKDDNPIELKQHKSKFEFLNNKGVNVGLNIKLIIRATNFTKGDLKVEDLNLSNLDVEELPDNLTVGEDLLLINTKIKVLPKNLTVGGNLGLYGTEVQSLPKTLKVGDRIYLNDKLSKIYGTNEIVQREVLSKPEALSESFKLKRL